MASLRPLFFKDPIVFACDQKSLIKCVRLAATANFHGYTNYAITILKE